MVNISIFYVTDFFQCRTFLEVALKSIIWKYDCKGILQILQMNCILFSSSSVGVSVWDVMKKLQTVADPVRAVSNILDVMDVSSLPDFTQLHGELVTNNRLFYRYATNIKCLNHFSLF